MLFTAKHVATRWWIFQKCALPLCFIQLCTASIRGLLCTASLVFDETDAAVLGCSLPVLALAVPAHVQACAQQGKTLALLFDSCALPAIVHGPMLGTVLMSVTAAWGLCAASLCSDICCALPALARPSFFSLLLLVLCSRCKAALHFKGASQARRKKGSSAIIMVGREFAASASNLVRACSTQKIFKSSCRWPGSGSSCLHHSLGCW